MLAYVFWHWKRPDVAVEVYESAQQRFHAALAAAPSAGFVGSRSAAIAGAPWIPAGREAYEDWYFVEDSAALDPLNDAAVSASRQQPHDEAAALAENGTAGLYRLRGGRLLNGPGHACWFGKPAGMSYGTLFETLGRELARVDHSLWTRQMVLGPTPEFCLQTAAAVALPFPVVCRTPLREVAP